MNIIRGMRNLWFAGRERRARPFVQHTSAFSDRKPAPPSVDKGEFFRFIAKDGRRSIGDVNKEFAGLATGSGKLTFEDYVRLRLYDPDGPNLDEKRRFISDKQQWYIISRISDPIYDALTQDKYVSYQFLSSLGFPVPRTTGVVTSGARTFPTIKEVRAPAELAELVRGAKRPLFFKANMGIASVDAFICDGMDGDHLITRPHGRKTAEEIFALIEERDFLIQEMLENHPDLVPITTALSTVRLTHFLVDGAIRSPTALMKLTADDVVADNFWRPGSMLAEVDQDSGKIRRVIRGTGPQMDVLNVAPKSGVPLTGFQIPFWSDIVSAGRAASLALAPIPFTSLDIAVTVSGPVIVEMNTGGSFDLPQLASGRGLLTPEVKRLLRL